MKQIAKATRYFTDKIKSYIIVGLIMVLVPSFAMSQNLIPKQENENKSTESIVPKVSPPASAGPMPYGTIFMLKKPIACNDTPLVKTFIENMNGMVPITMGTDRNAMGGITSLVQLYANPETENFAIVEHFAVKKSCIIFQGHDFDIILPERYYQGPDG
jgi:hypothetical protein